MKTEMKTSNPYPGLYLGGINDCKRRARSVTLEINITDPELAFALQRQANAVDRTVESYCTDAILSVLESDEDANQDKIDNLTGSIIAE
jgi:hypothetical protein